MRRRMNDHDSLGTRGPVLGLMGMVEAVGSRQRDEEIVMGRKVLTPAAAMEIKRLRAMKDSRGLPVYSQMKIAAMLGVSETTVFRVLNYGGAYGTVPELKTDEEAKASEARFRAANPELFQNSALEKMQTAVAEIKDIPARVEGMLKELDAGYLP